MSLLEDLFSFISRKRFLTQKLQERQALKAFILEPILTPSGLVDDPTHDTGFIIIDPHPGIDHSLDFSSDAYPGLDDAPDVDFHLSTAAIASENINLLPFIYDPEPTIPSVEHLFDSGIFTVGASGKVSIDYLFDGGGYQGQLAIFNLKGMEGFDLNTETGLADFIHEAAHRALSNSDLGHVVIADATEGAKFSGLMPSEWQDHNFGQYQGVKTFDMEVGDKFAVMLVPNGTVAQVLEGNQDAGMRPLFSLHTVNPNEAFHAGQIADVTGDGNTFVLEDLRTDHYTDRDYNDIIFQVRGATGTAVHLDDVINHDLDWRHSDTGQAIVEYAKSYVSLPEHPPISLDVPASHQPLIGIIDTGFSSGNSDIDYSRIISGRDYIDGDNDSFQAPGTGDEHGTFVLGQIGATQHNDIGIDGANDRAPIWVSRATGSGHWADALREFVDYAKESHQPNALINLSLDLTQVNHDGSVTTRYEFTPFERAALEYAHQNHVLIVAAAGNDGGTMSVLGQASQEFNNIITVGAAHQVNDLHSVADSFDQTDYSSGGRGLDIVANGGTADSGIISTVGDGVGTMSGTSVAAAQVTGAASQVWAANPDLSYRQVIDILKSTATDLKTPGWDAETGAGLLNIAAAVQLAKATKPEDYVPEQLLTLTSWSGEGKVTPGERAVSNYNVNNWGRIKYLGKLNSGDSSNVLEFTLNQPLGKIFKFSINFPEGNATLYRNGAFLTSATPSSATTKHGEYANLPAGSYRLVIDKGSRASIDPYEAVLNFTGLSGEQKALDDTIDLRPPQQPISQPPVFTNPQGQTVTIPLSPLPPDWNAIAQQQAAAEALRKEQEEAAAKAAAQAAAEAAARAAAEAEARRRREAEANARQAIQLALQANPWVGATKGNVQIDWNTLTSNRVAAIQYFDEGYILWNGIHAVVYKTDKGTSNVPRPEPKGMQIRLLDWGNQYGRQEYGRYVGNADRQDYYKFTAEELADIDAHRLLFALRVNGYDIPQSDAKLDLLNANMTVLASQSSAAPGFASIDGGSYYLRVKPTKDLRYDVIANLDSAGESLAGARHLSQITGRQEFRDFVGTNKGDGLGDYYNFDVLHKSFLRVKLSDFGYNGDANVELLDDQEKVLPWENVNGKYGDFLIAKPGSYYLRVTPANGSDTNYKMTVQIAEDLGKLAGRHEYSDRYLGGDYREAFYRLHLDEPSETLHLALKNLTGDANIQLLKDNGSGIVDSTLIAPVNDINQSGLTDEYKAYQNLGAGDYLVRVNLPNDSTSGAKYTLVTHIDNAGATWAEARDLGTLEDIKASGDYQFSDFVGADKGDAADVYKFQIAESGLVHFALKKPDGDAEANMLFANMRLQDESGKDATFFNPDKTTDNYAVANLVAGKTYYLTVTPSAGKKTNYNLVINPERTKYDTPQKAENFFNWARGQQNISALDGRIGLDGECVTLIARYLAEVFFPEDQKNNTVNLDNGGMVASAVANNYSQYFDSLTNEGLPKRGAVISFPNIGVVDGVTYGHVGIVTDAVQLPNGQRKVKIMDSNSPSGRIVVEHPYWINIPDGTANGYGKDIVWSNPKWSNSPSSANSDPIIFQGRVMTENGIISTLAPTFHSQDSGILEPYGKLLTFDGWTYGDPVNDYQLKTPDYRWFKIAGTNYWVPSGVIDGKPLNSSPIPSNEDSENNNSINNQFPQTQTEFEKARDAAFNRVGGSAKVGNRIGQPQQVNGGWYQEYEKDGRKNLVALQNGSGKAFWVYDSNYDEYMRLGGPRGDLGFPINEPENFTAKVTGTAASWQAFSAMDGTARIYHSNGKPVATWGSIGKFYQEIGDANSWLGVPLKTEWLGSDGVTTWAEFENGLIAHNQNGYNEAIQKNTNSEKIIEFLNLRCSIDYKTFSGIKAPDFCESVVDSGIFFDKDKMVWSRNQSSIDSIDVSFRAFNKQVSSGMVEVYDGERKLTDIKIIEGNELKTDFWNSTEGLLNVPNKLVFDEYKLDDLRVGLDKQEISINIPHKGYLDITKSSKIAILYNIALLIIELQKLEQGPTPEFVDEESRRKIFIGFAQEYAGRVSTKIFTSEPTLEGISTFKFLDPRALATILYEISQYALRSENNPLLGSMKEVFTETISIGIEKVIEKINPLLGKLATGIRYGGDVLNATVLAAEIYKSQQSDSLSIITVRNLIK